MLTDKDFSSVRFFNKASSGQQGKKEGKRGKRKNFNILKKERAFSVK